MLKNYNKNNNKLGNEKNKIEFILKIVNNKIKII